MTCFAAVMGQMGAMQAVAGQPMLPQERHATVALEERATIARLQLVQEEREGLQAVEVEVAAVAGSIPMAATALEPLLAPSWEDPPS